MGVKLHVVIGVLNNYHTQLRNFKSFLKNSINFT